MPTVKLATLALCVMLALARSADAQEADPVYLRATVPVNSAVDEYIARNAEPFVFSTAAREELSGLTPGEAITRLCGSVRAAYYRAVVQANSGSPIERDAPLGERASAIEMPACLFVARVDESTLPTPNGVAPTREELTGQARPTPLLVQLSRVFTPVNMRLVTAPVGLTPRDNLSAESFVAGVMAASRNDGVQTVAAPNEGQIILALDQANCLESAPAFDRRDIASIYRFARERAQARGQNRGAASIVIVDNGFYGARNLAWEEAWRGSPFPSYLFRQSSSSIIERELEPGESQSGNPLNYVLGLSPDVTSGHGTHVAGLAIGGPGFVDLDLYDARLPWMSVTIINVGNGGATVRPRTQGQLANALSLATTRRIVNMSIAFDGRTVGSLGQVYRELFLNAQDDLFVVAAGNRAQGRDVSDLAIYPAAFGGFGSSNVISVAALDGANEVAQFSNFGADNVDIGAPGCRVPSWIANDATTVPLSGTSAAAPIVTFASALVASMSDRFVGSELKTRLIVSGRLLTGRSASTIAYRVRLDIPRALFAMDDILVMNDVPSDLLGGDILQINGLSCADTGAEIPLENLWALKRHDQVLYAYRGRTTGAVLRPCRATLSPDASIVFRQLYRVHPGDPPGPVPLEPVEVGLDRVGDLIMRSR